MLEESKYDYASISRLSSFSNENFSTDTLLPYRMHDIAEERISI